MSAKKDNRFIFNTIFSIACSGNQNTKIHALVDGLGNPVAVLLNEDQINDAVLAIDLLQPLNLERINIIRDKTYGSKEIRDWLDENQAIYTIPPRENSKKTW